MNKLLSALAATLIARARERAEVVIGKQAAVAAGHQEVHSANAGGWN